MEAADLQVILNFIMPLGVATTVRAGFFAEMVFLLHAIQLLIVWSSTFRPGYLCSHRHLALCRLERGFPAIPTIIDGWVLRHLGRRRDEVCTRSKSLCFAGAACCPRGHRSPAKCRTLRKA